MSTDDTPVPEDDAIAQAAQRGLDSLAASGAQHAFSWSLVQARARSVQRRRLAAVATACAIVLLGAGAAFAAADRGTGNHLNVTGSGSTTEPTTSEPFDSSSAVRTTPSSAPSVPGGTNEDTSVPTTFPSAAPMAGDVTGTITVGTPADQQSVAVGASIDITANIRNVSNRTIWASSSQVPTSFATICTGQSPDTQSLWWMTNILLAPGDNDGRTGSFTPTDAYIGTVTCELDLVATDLQGTTFDTSAGGDKAQATIVGRVTGVPQVTLQVEHARWKVTTTGGVGPLQLGVSTGAEVQAAAGPPDGKGRGSFAAPNRPDFQALGYDCSDQDGADRIPLHPQPTKAGPYCRTVFYVNVNTGTLAAFDTTANNYAADNGVSVGWSEADAQQREGQAPVSGCFQGIALGDLAANPYEVFIWVGTQPTDRVSSISAEAASNQVGLMFC